MTFIMKNLPILSVFLTSVLAAPNPQFFPPAYCQTKYTVQSSKKVAGDMITGDYAVPAGGDLSAGSAFETSVTVQTGAGLDLNFGSIVSAGVSFAVSVTTTNQTSQGAGVNCPEGGEWHCALAIYPNFVEVSGQIEAANDYCDDESVNGKFPKPFVVRFPEIGNSGGVRADVEPCTCKNRKHWADPGHVALLCDNCPLGKDD